MGGIIGAVFSRNCLLVLPVLGACLTASCLCCVVALHAKLLVRGAIELRNVACSRWGVGGGGGGGEEGCVCIGRCGGQCVEV